MELEAQQKLASDEHRMAVGKSLYLVKHDAAPVCYQGYAEIGSQADDGMASRGSF
jgi:hypothetical protein